MRRRLSAGLTGASLMSLIGATVGGAQKPPGIIDSMEAKWSGVKTDLLEVKRMSDHTIGSAGAGGTPWKRSILSLLTVVVTR